MEWTTYRNPMGYSIEHPVGWTVQLPQGNGVVIASPDGQAFAVIQPLAYVTATAQQIIEQRLFPTAYLFPSPMPGQVTAGANGSANGMITYRPASGIPGRAQVAYVPRSFEHGMLYVAAAPHAQFPQFEPTLVRILQSLTETAPSVTASAQAPPPPPLPPPAATIPFPNFTKFTDPSGTFRMDVPVGWRIVAGLGHPQPGDRRRWWEIASPDGTYILCDPSFPQSLCHFPAQPDGQLTQLAAGGLFLNLKPSPANLTDCYLRQAGSRRFKLSQPLQRRPRPDIANLVAANLRRAGITPLPSFQIASMESIFATTQAGQPRMASLLATSVFNGQYMMNMWAFWDAALHLLIAPPELMQRGDQVRARMIGTFEITPKFMQIVQEDEAKITAAGQAANAAQWGWFNGVQQAHFAQEAAGNAIVNRYWETQAANDRMLRGWEHNQAINDRLSQARSDAMMDRQRLADEGAGKEYQCEAGYTNYWRNSATGAITGTNTDTPPDYSNNYTPLKKL